MQFYSHSRVMIIAVSKAKVPYLPLSDSPVEPVQKHWFGQCPGRMGIICYQICTLILKASSSLEWHCQSTVCASSTSLRTLLYRFSPFPSASWVSPPTGLFPTCCNICILKTTTIMTPYSSFSYCLNSLLALTQNFLSLPAVSNRSPLILPQTYSNQAFTLLLRQNRSEPRNQWPPHC